MEEKKSNNGRFFKRTLKAIGWFLLVIIAIVGIGALGAWMTGSFNPEKIYIQQLSINGVKEYVTITENDTSYTTKVDFAPENANQLTLTAKVLTGSGLIEPITNVVAGQPLELKFVKDGNGITKGGEVEIKFIDSAQKAFTTLKVLIDVGLDSNHIEITSNGAEMTPSADANVLSTSVLTTVLEENANIIKIGAGYDEMLNSYKGNWSPSENNNVVNLTKLKKMILRYDENVSVTDLTVSEVLGDENYYLIKYLTPATIENYELDVWLYKTYFLEKVFDLDFAEDLISAYENNNYDRLSFDYDMLNDFINSYVYNNSTVDVKNNFDTFNENGVVLMTPAKYSKNSEKFVRAIEDTLNYALAHKKILISVENIEVVKITNQNNNSELKFPVLQSETYTIQDVYNKLGISLEGTDESVDKQVLFNSLRDIDIVLCYETSKTNYEGEISGENATNNAEKKAVIQNHYKVGTQYFKKVDSSKFAIEKTYNDDGSATWKFTALSPVSSNDKYYIIFCYEKNNYEQTIDYDDPNDGKSITYTYTYTTKTINGSTTEWWYQSNNLITDMSLLNTFFNRVYACTPISVTYTNGSIQFNTTKNNDINVVNNIGSTSIVLNDINKVYINDNNGNAKVVRHGEEGGVYYKSRDFSVGIKKNESGIMTQNVIISAEDPSADMEYTHVKWFVKYFDNIIGENKAFSADNKYYLKPIINVSYDDSITEVNLEKKNEIPTPYKLKDISNNSYLENEAYFMEVGNNDFTLEALNAMPTEDPIPLYAVIIQTNIDGSPYVSNQGETTDGSGIIYTTYNFISQTNSHTVSTTQYIDYLNFYVNNWVNATTSSGNITEFNFVDVEKGSEETLYLTNFTLNSSGKAIVSSLDWVGDDNKIILKDAIMVEENQRIALNRFYNDFIASVNLLSVCIKYDQNINYESVTPLSIEPSYVYQTGNVDTANYITITIKHNMGDDLDNSDGTYVKYPFTLNIKTSENSLRGKFYTSATTIGYFNISVYKSAS